MMRSYCVLFAVILSALTGCTFQSSQLNTVLGFFEPQQQVDHQWRASYGNKKAGVIALKQSPFLVFANNKGEAISFDGWRIQALTGFGLRAPIKLRFEGNNPIFGTRLQSQQHICQEWIFSAAQTRLHTAASGHQVETKAGQWVQRCEGETPYQNTIALDASGRIIQINQVVDASGTRLVVEKL